MRPIQVPLHTFRTSVLTSIQFNRETQRWAIEVQHKWSSGVLAAEINTELSVPQFLPKHHFNVR
jgi:hypothetical protein